MNKDYQTAFHILIKMKSKKLFDFMHKVKLDVNLETYLPQLLIIDAPATVDYLMKKYGKYQKTKVLDQCMGIIQEIGEDDSPDVVSEEDPQTRDREFLMHLLLHEIANRGDLEVSQEYHQKQVELYCRYDPSQLLSFLGKVDSLNIYEAMKTCHENRQFKEEAYLLAKFGKDEQAIEVLISNCSDFAETVDFAL